MGVCCWDLGSCSAGALSTTSMVVRIDAGVEHMVPASDSASQTERYIRNGDKLNLA
jgi:hypothetical protein